MYDQILHGKNELPYIVAIEPEDTFATIYQEYKGKVTSSIINHEYWLLSGTQPSKDFTELKGELFYKYGKKYNLFEDWLRDKNTLRRANYNTYSINNPDEALMVKDGYTLFKSLSLKDVSCLAFDIEATGLTHDKTSKVLLISNIYRDGLGKVTKKLFAYDDYANEVEMLNDWCEWVKHKDPSVILGYNITAYDLPYMDYCMARNGMSLNLGRNNTKLKFENFERKYRVDGNRTISYKRPHIFGRQIIDVYFLSLKYDIGRKYESYSLKWIIKFEGLESTDRVFYDASQIRFKYKDPKEWAQIKLYCEDDAVDVLNLYDLMANTYFLLAQYIPKSFQSIIESASGSQLNSMMVRSYLQLGHSLPKADDAYKFEGGISDGNPGIYKHALKVDAKSMYPSIIIGEKLFNKNKDPHGNLLHITEVMTKQRLYNREMFEKTNERKYKDLSDLNKVVINSLYGFLGAPGLLFNWIKGAEFVTKKGREIITEVVNWSNQNKFTLINVDTDSITFTNNKELSEQEQHNYIKDLNKLYPDKIEFSNDGYFQDVIVVAAKNYVLYDGKKLRIKGSSLKSPKMALALREYLTEMFWAIIKQTNNYDDIYIKYVKEINNLTDIKRWATRQTISDKTLNSDRTNESKVRDAIEDSEYTEGSRIWTYFKSDDSLGLVEHFDGDYNRDRLYVNLYNAAMRFENILNVEKCVNFKLKRNKEKLNDIK